MAASTVPRSPHFSPALVEQSLVQSAGGRFWLLETLRTYAVERLGPGPLDRLRSRHAQHTAGRLRALNAGLWSDREPETVREVFAMLPDLQQAWEQAAAADRPLALRMAGDVFDFAYPRQRLDLLQWASTAVAWDLETPDLPAALRAAACAAWASGRMDEAAAHVDRGYALTGGFAGAAAPGLPDLLDVRADLDMFSGRGEQAVRGYEAVARLRTERGDVVHALSAEIAAGQARSYGSNRSQVLTALPDLLSRAERFGNPTVLCFAYFLAGDLWRDDDLQRSLDAFATSSAHGRRADSQLFLMMAETSRLALLAARGPTDDALRACEDVLERWEDLGNRAAQWWSLLQVVVLLHRVGNGHDAALLAGAERSARERMVRFSPLWTGSSTRTCGRSWTGWPVSTPPRWPGVRTSPWPMPSRWRASRSGLPTHDRETAGSDSWPAPARIASRSWASPSR